MPGNLSKVKYCGVSQVIYKALFVRAFEEARKGKPFKGDKKWSTNDWFLYERGRQFFFYCESVGKGAIQLKEGRRVRYEAVSLLSDAVVRKAII